MSPLLSLKTTVEFPVIWDAMSLTQRHCDVIYLCNTVISVLLKAVMNKLVHICPSVFKFCVRCNWLWCFGNTAIQSQSPHKTPLILCLTVFFVVSLSKLLKQQSCCWCWKTSSCVISYIFSFKFKVQTQILKFLGDINNDYNQVNILLRWYVLLSSLLWRSTRT